MSSANRQAPLSDANATVRSNLQEWWTNDQHAVAAALEDWQRELQLSGLHFEGKPYPVSVRPLILDSLVAQDLSSDFKRLHALLEKVADLYRDHQRVRSFFGVYQNCEQHILSFPDYRPLTRICRFDGVLAADGDYKLFETNTACPGSVIQTGIAGRLWLGSVFRSLLPDKVRLSAQPLVEDSHLFVRHLVSTAASVGVAEPSVAIVNLRGQYTNEVDWMLSGFHDLGVPAILYDGYDLAFRGTKLCAGDRVITLVYNKLDQLRFLDTADRPNAYLEAISQQAVCSINPLVSQFVTEDKSALALLSDPAHSEYFTPDERDLIQRRIPWTRRFDTGYTTGPGAQRVFLPDYVKMDQNHLVLKPTNLTRGEGVVLGAHVSESEWDATMQAALTRPYVVQQYVALPSIEVAGGPTLSLSSMHCDLSCFLFGGEVVGFRSRGSQSGVVNIGQGGTVLPVLVGGAL